MAGCVQLQVWWFQGKGGQRGRFRVSDGRFRPKCLGMNATAPLQNDSARVQNGFAPVQNRSAACKVILHPCKVILHPCRMAAHPCGTTPHPCKTALRPRKVALQARNLILHGCKTAMHAHPDTRNGSAAPEQPARANPGNSAQDNTPAAIHAASQLRAGVPGRSLHTCQRG